MSDIPLRELLEHMMGELEKRVYQEFASQKEMVKSAFLASEQAIAKSEAAQKAYNERSNEFRDALSDQAATLMPRAEAESRFRTLDAKNEDIKKDVIALRESHSESTGKESASDRDAGTVKWGIGIIVAIGLSLLSLIVNLLRK
jgi:hypothetical protein